ncbi:MAG TPA: dihydrolipoyl dehydrogenase [Janthinobacterium sp.]|jgi:dihydrolipoamide dehydrogenase|nr:dihydrolipoyl dehydrogenase [Janthinobacterium sp.]
MNVIKADVAVIGSGTAGMTAYRAARVHGKRVVLVENHLYGSTCARVGCMPSKLLIAAAEAAHALTAAPAFGVFPGSARVDGHAVMARVRSERDRFVGFVQDMIDDIPPEDKVHGHARFAGPQQLQVDQHTLIEASRIVIASGSRPIVPQEWKGAGARLIVSDDVFDWTDLPASVAVIGTGAIGLELGQALHRLGVRVRIYARGSSVAQLSDPLVLQAAAAALSAELDLRFQTLVAAVERDGERLLVSGRDAEGKEHAASFDYVLVAIGRSPNVHDIGLELARLALDRRGVPLYDRDTMQCGSSTIFIAGDADDERPVLPEAADQGRIAGDNAGRYPDLRPGLRRTPLAVAFSEPQIATLGARYADLCRTHAGKFAIGAVSFENQGRSRVMLQNHGMLRVYGEFGSGRFLGAEMIGPRAEHLGHLLAWACQAGLTVEAMLDMPFYHPVVEEGVRTALRDLAANLLKLPQPCVDCSPGI